MSDDYDDYASGYSDGFREGGEVVEEERNEARIALARLEKHHAEDHRGFIESRRSLVGRIRQLETENAELRGEVERLTTEVAFTRDLFVKQGEQHRQDAERWAGTYVNEASLRRQLAAAQAQLAKHRDRGDAAEARLEAVRTLAWEKVAASIDAHGIRHGYPMIPAERVLNLIGVECDQDGCPLPYAHGGPHAALSAAPVTEPPGESQPYSGADVESSLGDDLVSPAGIRRAYAERFAAPPRGGEK